MPLFTARFILNQGHGRFSRWSARWGKVCEASSGRLAVSDGLFVVGCLRVQEQPACEQREGEARLDVRAAGSAQHGAITMGGSPLSVSCARQSPLTPLVGRRCADARPWPPGEVQLQSREEGWPPKATLRQR